MLMLMLQVSSTLPMALRPVRRWDAAGAELPSDDGPAEPNQRWSLAGLTYDECDCRAGVAVTCCGHMMHTACFRRLQRAGRLQQPGMSITEASHGELQCPLCRRVANTLLPAAAMALTAQRAVSISPVEQQEAAPLAAPAAPINPLPAATSTQQTRRRANPAQAAVAGLWGLIRTAAGVVTGRRRSQQGSPAGGSRGSRSAAGSEADDSELVRPSERSGAEASGWQSAALGHFLPMARQVVSATQQEVSRSVQGLNSAVHAHVHTDVPGWAQQALEERLRQPEQQEGEPQAAEEQHQGGITAADGSGAAVTGTSQDGAGSGVAAAVAPASLVASTAAAPDSASAAASVQEGAPQLPAAAQQERSLSIGFMIDSSPPPRPTRRHKQQDKQEQEQQQQQQTLVAQTSAGVALEAVWDCRIRLATCSPSQQLWALLAHGVARWEAVHRPSNAVETSAVPADSCLAAQAAALKALQGITALCCAVGAGTGAGQQQAQAARQQLLQLLQWLQGQQQQPAAAAPASDAAGPLALGEALPPYFSSTIMSQQLKAMVDEGERQFCMSYACVGCRLLLHVCPFRFDHCLMWN